MQSKLLTAEPQWDLGVLPVRELLLHATVSERIYDMAQVKSAAARV